MDFWSRLVGGSGTSPTKPLRANTPAERLAAFKRTCNALQQVWRTPKSLRDDDTTLNYTRNCLKRLNTLLDDESRGPAPYPCLLHAATSQFYIIVTKLALAAFDVELLDDAARFFNILIDGEAEGVLDSRIFARALIDLVKRTTGNVTIAVGPYEEGNLIELLFAVANKIRMDPDILQAWFYPERNQQGEKSGTSSGFAGNVRKNDFPLFYLLVEYVHHDGRIGDFARTGLLYLTETASKSRYLEKWMIESDLATLMASGLGALYSRLSRRLPSGPLPDQLPVILTLSDFEIPSGEHEADPSEFHHDMDAFMGYLMFWQDTLYHCASAEVTDTLLDHFQILFLQQLLYPSLLESSDIDGGSTASVIAYLHRILDVVDHPELSRRILRYLLATQTGTQSKNPPRMSLSRRKSLDVLTALAKAEDNPSPDLFNLVDLIAMCLRSKQSRTVASTLKLVSVILRKHHAHAPSSLFKTTSIVDEIHRTPVQLDYDMRSLFSLATTIADDGTIDQSYEELSTDAVNLLEVHSCSLQPAGGSRNSVQALTADDSAFAASMELLRNFFSNSVIVNLALTEALANLASCPSISLNGWFWARPTANPSDDPTVFTFLKELTDQARAWQSEMSEWDTLMAAQKASLTEDLTREAPRFAAPAKTLDGPRTPTHSKRPSLDLPNQMMDAYTQSITPRGRKPLNIPTIEARASSSGSVSPSPAPRSPLFPQHHKSRVGSPLRDALVPPLTSFSTQQSSRTPSSAPDALRSRVSVSTGADEKTPKVPAIERLRLGSDISSDPGTPGTVTPSDQGQQTPDPTVSLGHIITNAIILQDFILEMAAVAQMRACLFGEIRFE
ncbi:putative dna polymerase epsilon subunit c [Phaeomoniella chlamydospora]|uniref:Putative dna polymerase epsilon subunit c n=1 Tax=Phaeomoniella chlamydospora TaxID=158046 RepID=A0A0G2GVN8_PHACM|nr:putative dna polymerase epsilon subunit c [Phaeomoniella chlamydospora]